MRDDEHCAPAGAQGLDRVEHPLLARRRASAHPPLPRRRDRPGARRGARRGVVVTRDPLWRALALLDVRWRRATLAVLAGVAAVGSAVGLTAVSAWLIARASQLPPVLDLQVAVVAVRALGISRGVFRYLERLASHDVALSGMVRLREEVYRRLAEGRAGAVAALPRGDLLARIGADVDAVGDAVVRALLPAGIAAVLALGTVALSA